MMRVLNAGWDPIGDWPTFHTTNSGYFTADPAHQEPGRSGFIESHGRRAEAHILVGHLKITQHDDLDRGAGRPGHHASGLPEHGRQIEGSVGQPDDRQPPHSSSAGWQPISEDRSGAAAGGDARV